MHAWARWAVISAIFGLSASVALPARASFGDCEESVEYLAAFDSRIESRLYQCVERLRVPVSTSGGQRHIRIIHDFNAEWITGSGVLPEFDRGVRGAAEAIGRLGGVELNDITVFLTDDLPPPEGAHQFSNIAAEVGFRRTPRPGDADQNGECGLTVYLGGPAGARHYAAQVIAHEIFHCVQLANLSDAQMSSGRGGLGGGGDWWIEGSAEWFTALALPDPGPLPERVDAFDAASATTPLYRIAYDAVPFFLWLGQETSPPSVMAFLRQMAGESSDAAQRAAMNAALPPESWLRFAETYLDGEIRHPHGVDLGFAAETGDTWSWSDTRTQSIALEPFVIVRGVADFACGRWRTGAAPDNVSSARLHEGGPWGELPPEIDTSSGASGSYRVAAINTTQARIALAVEGTLESGCGVCLDIVETDACLFGTWRLAGGGGAEWANRQLPGRYSTVNESMTFRRDGSFITGAAQITADTRVSGSGGHGQAVAQSGGRWSARDGRLNMCADMQTLSGQTVITFPDGQRAVIPVPDVQPGSAVISYVCNATSLRTEIPIPGAPPIISEYTRVSD